MTQLHFAAPQWVHLFWAVGVFVAVLFWLDRGRGEAMRRMVGAQTLRARLVSSPGRTQRLARIVFLGLTGVFLTLALMRPQWGVELVQSERAGAEIMVCLDVSKSMLAEDVVPNRLDRAKAEVRDLLDLLDGDQVGLIAFAGRASVLSPLTPDFGFLRLALNDATPNSVTRGGTRLEEPIRKAVLGFGDAGDVSRSIILITDGEDHDSFPLEAAKEAADRGVRILAIGFGDETGANIPITDATTGARTLLTDADGATVSSRLDGDLLREMALLTDGAYVPAGTGVLDLEEIYERHIKPLTRGRIDGHTRTVRNDAFQWAILLALACLLGAVMSTRRSALPTRSINGGTIAILAVAVLTFMHPHSTLAQTNAGPTTENELKEEQSNTDTTADGSEQDAAQGEEDNAIEQKPIPEDPRDAYNEGLRYFEANDTENAARLLEGARAKAGTDNETRYRATYNLGWVDVKSADALIESEPAAALERLERAASWFREAVTLRPSENDPRHNLEVVMRRALELRDTLAGGADGDILKKLGALIEKQREFALGLREGVAGSRAITSANVTPELRRHFRRLSNAELLVLADADSLSEQMVQEVNGLASKGAQAAAPDDALRAAALEASIGHLHNARERIAQTRARLRKSQGVRAYRRAAAALDALQRAEDQLLDPVARLDGLLANGIEVARATAAKAAAERALLPSGTESQTAGPQEKQPGDAQSPAWLTLAYLSETQERLTTRTRELHEGLAAGLAKENSPGSAPANGPAPGDEQAQATLVEQLKEATPLIADAGTHFADASSALGVERMAEALDAQSKALEALRTAREYFLDLRRLIELVYGEEVAVQSLITNHATESANTSAPPHAESLAQTLELATSMHTRNVRRTIRLGSLLTDAMTQAATQQQTGENAPDGAAAPAASGQGAHFEQAYNHLRQAQSAMHKATRGLEQLSTDSIADEANSTSAQQAANGAPLALAQVREPVDEAVNELEALRRLFFSVLEHLRDAARRQQVLADETEAVATLSKGGTDDELVRQAGPIGHKQSILAETTQKIVETLEGQATAVAKSQANEQATPDGQQQAAPGPDPERLRQAAELVSNSTDAMQHAAKTLNNQTPLLDDARSSQDDALQALAEAIALLQQSEEQDQEQNQNNEQNTGEDQDQQEQDQDQQNQDGQQNGGQEAQQPQQEDPQQPGNMTQLLQGVRDREASRREDAARKAQRLGGYEAVEQDW